MLTLNANINSDAVSARLSDRWLGLSRVVAQAFLLASLLFATSAVMASSNVHLKVYQDPNCGCCGAWVDYMKAEGFNVQAIKTSDVTAYKQQFGVPPKLASCHTAVVEETGQVIEGHVPADDIKALLEERPEVAGLAVPGMPHGSPGMETGREDDYAVLSWTRDSQPPEIFREYIQ